MKNMRTLALILALAMCFSLLAACGGIPATTATPAPTAAAPATGEPDAPAEPVKVGVLAPLTGPVAQYGNAVNNGIMLYIEEYNAAGGFKGAPVELVTYDEEGDAAKAVTGYNSLFDQGITALIGSVTTTPTLAVVPVALEDNMPMITASATAAAVTVNEETGEVYTNMFRSCFIDPFQGEKMADFAYNELGAKTAAILFCSEDDYSIGLKDFFVKKAGDLGLEIIAMEGFGANAVDYKGQLTNIASKNPDVVFIPYYYENVALAAPQAAEAGITAPLLGADGWDGVLDIIADASFVEGAYFCSGYSVDDPRDQVQDFLTAYQTKYNGEVPNMFAAQAYDAAAIMLAAMEKATGEVGSEEYRLSVIAELSATDMDGVTGHVTYDELNNPQKTATINYITGGVATFWGSY